MKSTLLSYAALASLVHLATADVEPFLSYDINTIKDCSFWYDNYGTKPCASVRATWNISPETFSRWNPSVSLDCTGWGRHSYCVGVVAELTRSSSRTTSSSSTPTTTASTPPPVWTDHGCYADASVHPFQTQLAAPAGADMTRAACESRCWRDGYQFAGAKAGTECWCGHYVEGSRSPSPSDCGAPCAGNASETCGGARVFNVLEGNDAQPPSACTAAATRASTSTAPARGICSGQDGAVAFKVKSR
ncbi:WSC domain protein [Cordyceps militaris CM01]|uniref:WSC domain protein n=1 Tax=Cordyceps militaris (strain CM01) TaxID=983644 RepID=G3JG07_CORMM|nr:WSC domain protein [Cordyceps militaris CM01]EGX93625.1 WSC domain protein [Cordyceps militaris CM01]